MKKTTWKITTCVMIILLVCMSVMTSCDKTEKPDVSTNETEESTVCVDPEGLRFVSNGDGTCYLEGVYSLDHVETLKVTVPEVSPAGDTVTGIQGIGSHDIVPDVLLKEDFEAIREKVRLYFGATDGPIGDTLSIGDFYYRRFCAYWELKTKEQLDAIEDEEARKKAWATYPECAVCDIYVLYEDTHKIEREKLHKNISDACPEYTALDRFEAWRRVLDVVEKNNISGSYTVRVWPKVSASSITEVILPKTLTSIGDRAFAYHSSIASITIHEGVTEIGNETFLACSGLKDLYYAGTTEQWANVKKEAYDLLFCAIHCADGDIAPAPKSDGLAYISNGDGTCSVIGLGTCADRDVIIPQVNPDGDKVTSIAERAFAGCTDITSITIPDGITDMGKEAFSGCTSLTNTVIPDSVTSIGPEAFSDCTGLTSITIPASVTFIYPNAFINCTGLTSIEVAEGNAAYRSQNNCLIEIENGVLLRGCNDSVIPTDGSVKEIGDSAFSGCTDFTSVTIPDGVKVIGANAFSGCTGLMSITIPDSVTGISYEAFSGCTGLMSITIPDSVTRIANGVFSGCTSLTSITIPDSVTLISRGAFSGCTSLTSIVIPASLERIYADMILGCTGLTSLIVSEGNPLYHSQGNCVISNDGELVLGCKNSVIPADGSVTSIGDNAFQGCIGLTSLLIPACVANIEDGAFSGCSGLTSIEVAEGNTVYHSADNCLIETESKKLLLGCKNSVIPEDGSVKSIRNGAFSGCVDLMSLTIPAEVTRIDSAAFSGCTGLTSIEVAKGNPVYHSQDNCLIETKNRTLLLGCKNSRVPANGSVTNIGRYAFSNCVGLVSMIIPDSVISIDQGAFSDCIGLTSITIPGSVKSLNPAAFSGCHALTEVHYHGTMEQWNQFGGAIRGRFSGCTIHCTDGDITPEQ